MKLHRTFTVVALALAGTIMTPRLSAQAEPAAAGRGGQGQFMERMKGLFTDMKLDEVQRERLKTIMMEQGERLRDLSQDTNLSREEKMKKMRELSQEMDPKIKYILTPEQYEQWQKKRDEAQKQLGGPGGAAGGLQDRMKSLFAELNLTPEQQEKVKEVYSGQREKMRELMTDQNLSREDKMAKYKEVDDAIQPKIKEILTADQYEKYEKKRQELRSQAGTARPGGPAARRTPKP